MIMDYTHRLLCEDLPVVEFLEHCSGVFRKRIDTNTLQQATPVIPPHDDVDTNSEVEQHYMDELLDELDHLHLMNETQRVEFGTQKRTREIQGYESFIHDGLTLRKRLIDMENKIHRWDAPSQEFEVFKEFVIVQVQNTIIENNEDIDHYKAELKIATDRTPPDYYKQAVYRAKQDLEYCQNRINQAETECT